jgi:Rad3-related DNA helicase
MVREVQRKAASATAASRQEAPCLDEQVTADLVLGGIISSQMTGYAERPAQIEMARLVARAITGDIPAVIEAATGTGKTIAYLIPLARSGKVGLISTANKALQEQLFYKDIPFVQRHVTYVEAALVKGMGNYVCLDRLDRALAEQKSLQGTDFPALLHLIDASDADWGGDFESLGAFLPPALLSLVRAESDLCTWNSCRFFDDCYLHQVRERAAQARIIVVNHTLMLLNAAVGGALLPRYDVLIVDEAQHLEEEATHVFTLTVSPEQVSTLVALGLLKEYGKLALIEAVQVAQQQAWERLAQGLGPSFTGKIRLSAPLEEGLALSSRLADLAGDLAQVPTSGMTEQESLHFAKLVKRTQNLAKKVQVVFSVDNPRRYVYYVERVSHARGFGLHVSAAPLSVAEWLQTKVFLRKPRSEEPGAPVRAGDSLRERGPRHQASPVPYAVVCTSATLSTPDAPGASRAGEASFAYFRRSIGLVGEAFPQVEERVLPTTFDYRTNALLYLPVGLPDPGYASTREDDLCVALGQEMRRLVEVSRGRAFLLFSSRRMLERVHQELCSPPLPYPLLRQGEVPRRELLRRFQETPSVLLGLKQFWEGVDIPGDALSLVVIDKLPFDPPHDPIQEARVALMREAGEDWFGGYVLPRAVLRLKQGMGRLLRTASDRGVMAVLDPRLHTRQYGPSILRALPPARRTGELAAVGQFFAAPRARGEYPGSEGGGALGQRPAAVPPPPARDAHGVDGRDRRSGRGREGRPHG